MNQAPDMRAYKVFKKLKQQFPHKFVTVTERDLALQGLHLAYKNHREYIEAKLRQEGIVITRWTHDYASLDTDHPQLGVVFMGTDSVIDEGLEAHVLIGHNAQYIAGTA